MRIVGGIALFSMGAVMGAMYEKYGQPVVKKASESVDSTMKKASKKLENMM